MQESVVRRVGEVEVGVVAHSLDVHVSGCQARRVDHESAGAAALWHCNRSRQADVTCGGHDVDARARTDVVASVGTREAPVDGAGPGARARIGADLHLGCLGLSVHDHDAAGVRRDVAVRARAVDRHVSVWPRPDSHVDVLAGAGGHSH